MVKGLLGVSRRTPQLCTNHPVRAAATSSGKVLARIPEPAARCPHTAPAVGVVDDRLS